MGKTLVLSELDRLARTHESFSVDSTLSGLTYSEHPRLLHSPLRDSIAHAALGSAASPRISTHRAGARARAAPRRGRASLPRSLRAHRCVSLLLGNGRARPPRLSSRLSCAAEDRVR